jgi:hypothetical protein
LITRRVLLQRPRLVRWLSLSLIAVVLSLLGLQLLSSPIAAAPKPAILMATPTASATATPATANLLANGSFENTGGGWLAPWGFAVRSGAAATVAQDGASRADGAYAARVDVTQAAASGWLVQLQQGGLPLAAGRAYTITFAARAAAPRAAEVVLQQNVSPYGVLVSRTVALTTAWQTFTVPYQATAAQADTFLGFNLAAAAGQVWLDAVALAPTPSVAPAASLVANGSFENTGGGWLAPWGFAVRSGAAATVAQDGASRADGAYAARVDVTQAAASGWLVQLQQGGLPLAAGRAYTITFAARAAAPRAAEVVLQQNVSPYGVLVSRTVALTTAWQTFTVPYQATAAQADTFLGFNLAAAAGQVWLDAVALSADGAAPAPTATPTVAPTATTMPTATATPVPTATPTPTATVSAGGDKLLIADNLSRRLLITDLDGRLVWEFDNPTGKASAYAGPLGVRWLPGNKILATFGEGDVGVIDVATKTFDWRISGIGTDWFQSPYDAEILPDGNIAVAMRYNEGGRVVVFDRATGTVVWKRLLSNAHTIHYRPQGYNTPYPTLLIGGWGAIEEVTYRPADVTGGRGQSVVWSAATEYTHDAQVVENDRVLTVEGYYIQKIDRAGAQLWRQATPDEDRRMAVNPVGGYIFSVAQGNRIEFRDLDGNLVRQWGTLSDGTPLHYPYGIQVIRYP